MADNDLAPHAGDELLDVHVLAELTGRAHRTCDPATFKPKLPHIGFGNEVTQFKVGSKTPLDCRWRAFLLIVAWLACYPTNTKLSLTAPVSRARSKVPSVIMCCVPFAAIISRRWFALNVAMSCKGN